MKLFYCVHNEITFSVSSKLFIITLIIRCSILLHFYYLLQEFVIRCAKCPKWQKSRCRGRWRVAPTSGYTYVVGRSRRISAICPRSTIAPSLLSAIAIKQSDESFWELMWTCRSGRLPPMLASQLRDEWALNNLLSDLTFFNRN